MSNARHFHTHALQTTIGRNWVGLDVLKGQLDGLSSDVMHSVETSTEASHAVNIVDGTTVSSLPVTQPAPQQQPTPPSPRPSHKMPNHQQTASGSEPSIDPCHVSLIVEVVEGVEEVGDRWVCKKRRVADKRRSRPGGPTRENKGPGFQTAKTKLIEDYRSKLGRDDYKPPFLTKKSSGTGVKGKFTPPFGKDTQQTDNTNGPLSKRSLELLSKKSGEIPESIQNFDLALVEAVCSEILDDGTSVQWDDIAGQETAKQLIQEMIVWPIMNPHLFTGARTPPKGLLLFGPPGTGKTLIGRAIAGNIRATFFSISASSLTSKWIGEGEKMVRILFAVARTLEPTVIFIDEIDSILSARKSEGRTAIQSYSYMDRTVSNSWIASHV